MTTETAMNQVEDKTVAIIFASILISVLFLATIVILGALGGAYDSYSGNVTETNSVINESGYINTTGYTLDYYGTPRTSTFTLTALYNATDDTSIGLGNATLTSGVITNATTTEWDDVLVSYTYIEDTTNSTQVNIGINEIKTNITNMVSNFFELSPTIGTILMVVILISVIVLLVVYLSRMRNTGNSGEEVFRG